MKELKKQLLGIYRAEFAQEAESKKNETSEKEARDARALEDFKTHFKELYALTEQAGIFGNVIGGDAMDADKVIFQHKNKTCEMQFTGERIKPYQGCTFDRWNLDKLLKTLDAELEIIPSAEYEKEKAKFNLPE